jgi:hypothetical protein
MSEYIKKLYDYEERIKRSVGDDEGAHSLEDEAMIYFIENCDKMSRLDLLDAQRIFARIKAMDFARWCA